MSRAASKSARRVFTVCACLVLLALPGPAPAQSGPDDRPYDAQLVRLAEILGAIHYLRELCGADEGQLWRNQMREILRSEGSTAIRRAKLVKSFNKGYRGYRRTYRDCNESARTAIARFMEEGAQLTGGLTKQN
jgi:uncharacterized protein (TIGR02301 family)